MLLPCKFSGCPLSESANTEHWLTQQHRYKDKTSANQTARVKHQCHVSSSVQASHRLPWTQLKACPTNIIYPKYFVYIIPSPGFMGICIAAMLAWWLWRWWCWLGSRFILIVLCPKYSPFTCSIMIVYRGGNWHTESMVRHTIMPTWVSITKTSRHPWPLSALNSESDGNNCNACFSYACAANAAPTRKKRKKNKEKKKSRHSQFVTFLYVCVCVCPTTCRCGSWKHKRNNCKEAV